MPLSSIRSRIEYLFEYEKKGAVVLTIRSIGRSHLLKDVWPTPLLVDSAYRMKRNRFVHAFFKDLIQEP